MKDLKNEIKACFTSYDTEDKQEQLSVQLNIWLVKAKEEMQYGDVNDAITIALTIIEELSLREDKESALRESYIKALEITGVIFKTPSTRSDIRLLLEYELQHLRLI